MKAIAYYRVSTERQGRSGLGLEAQRATVEAFFKDNGCTPVNEFVEVESGRKSSRVELKKAIDACRIQGATLVIAKLDRLARNAAFLLNLRNSGIEFVACDMPNANKLTVGIMALVAEDEAERISQRTKDALQAAKARGVKLGGYRGGPVPNDAARGASAAVRQQNASDYAKAMKGTIDELLEEGISSANGIAKALNKRGITTARGKRWQAVSVQRLLSKL